MFCKALLVCCCFQWTLWFFQTLLNACKFTDCFVNDHFSHSHTLSHPAAHPWHHMLCFLCAYRLVSIIISNKSSDIWLIQAAELFLIRGLQWGNTRQILRKSCYLAEGCHSRKLIWHMLLTVREDNEATSLERLLCALCCTEPFTTMSSSCFQTRADRCFSGIEPRNSLFGSLSCLSPVTYDCLSFRNPQ